MRFRGFTPGTTDVTEYSKKLQFLAAMWPKESIALLAPRAALLCEGTAFKKVSKLPADKLKSNDESGVQLLVSKLPADKLKSNDESGVQLLVATLGGAWGRSDVERKYDVFEKAIFGTIQKADESNDSYLARHDVHFEELLSQSVTLEEVRAYVLLRQSALSAEDRKKIVVEMSGALKYDKVSSAIRLLGSRFFSDLQGQRGAFRNKTYDANVTEESGPDETDRIYHAAIVPGSHDEGEGELEPEYLEALIAAEDSDALVVQNFEEELENFFQETPELQEALATTTFAEECPIPASAFMTGTATEMAGEEILTELPEEAARTVPLAELGRLTISFGKQNKGRSFEEAEALELELTQDLDEEFASTPEPIKSSRLPKSKAAPRAVTKPGDDQWDVVPALEPSHRVDEQINDLNGRVLQMESLMHQMLSAIQQLSQPQQPLP
eukprot:s612_g5.t1